MRCTMKFLTIILYKHLPPHKHIKPLIGLCRRCIFRLFQIDTTSVFGIWMASYIQVTSILKDTQGYLSSIKIDF